MYEVDDDPTGYVHVTKGMNPQSCMADLRQNRCRKALTENNAYPMGRPWIWKSEEAKEKNKVIEKKDARLLKKNKRAMKNLMKTKEWAEAEAGGYTQLLLTRQELWVPASKKRKMGRRKARRVKSPDVTPKVAEDKETSDSEDSYA